MSIYIHKSHNVSVLLYHLVCPAKYRRVVFVGEVGEVDEVLKDVCLEIAKRYEITFLEIGTDREHVHFLVQSVPTYSPTKIVRTIKSITAREVFARLPSFLLSKSSCGVASSGQRAISSTLSDDTQARKSSGNTCKNKDNLTLTASSMNN